MLTPTKVKAALLRWHSNLNQVTGSLVIAYGKGTNDSDLAKWIDNLDNVLSEMRETVGRIPKDDGKEI